MVILNDGREICQKNSAIPKQRRSWSALLLCISLVLLLLFHSHTTIFRDKQRFNSTQCIIHLVQSLFYAIISTNKENKEIRKLIVNLRDARLDTRLAYHMIIVHSQCVHRFVIIECENLLNVLMFRLSSSSTDQFDCRIRSFFEIETRIYGDMSIWRYSRFAFHWSIPLIISFFFVLISNMFWYLFISFVLHSQSEYTKFSIAHVRDRFFAEWKQQLQANGFLFPNFNTRERWRVKYWLILHLSFDLNKCLFYSRKSLSHALFEHE